MDQIETDDFMLFQMLLYCYYNVIVTFVRNIKVNGSTFQECILSAFFVKFNIILQCFLKRYKNGTLFTLLAKRFVTFGLRQCTGSNCFK